MAQEQFSKWGKIIQPQRAVAGLAGALAPTLRLNLSLLESLKEDVVQGRAGGASDTVDAYVPRNTEGQPGTLVKAGSCAAHAHAATAIIRILLLWHLFLIYLISI